MNLQDLKDPNMDNYPRSDDEIQTLLAKFKCKACSYSFESLIQHLNKREKCNSQYSVEELDQLKEQSKKRKSLKNKLWKQDHKEWRAGYNATYYEKNHSIIADKNKTKYWKKKEEAEILRREKSLQNIKGLFEMSKASTQRKYRSNNSVGMGVYESTTLKFIKKFRIVGVDDKTEDTFKMYENEASEIFQSLETKIEVAEKKSNEIVFETPNHFEKISAIYKEAELDCMYDLWDKFHDKCLNFLENVAFVLNEDFKCPRCFWVNGKLSRLCPRCKSNKKKNKKCDNKKKQNLKELSEYEMIREENIAANRKKLEQLKHNLQK